MSIIPNIIEIIIIAGIILFILNKIIIPSTSSYLAQKITKTQILYLPLVAVIIGFFLSYIYGTMTIFIPLYIIVGLFCSYSYLKFLDNVTIKKLLKGTILWPIYASQGYV